MAEVDELGFKPVEDLGFKPQDGLEFKPSEAPEAVRGSDNMLLGGSPPPEPDFMELVKEQLTVPFFELTKPVAEADDPSLLKFGKGLAQSGIGVVEGLETPLGVSLLASSFLPGVGKAVGRVAGAGFGVKTTLDGFKEAAQAYQSGDMEKAGRALGNLILGGAMVRGSVASPRVAEGARATSEKPAPERTVTAAEVEGRMADVPLEPPTEPPASRPLIDEQRIKTAIVEQDVMPGRDWVASPEFEFRKNPEASALVTRLNEQELRYKHDVAEDVHKFDALKDQLTSEEQVQVTTALRALEKGDSRPLETLTPEGHQAVDSIRVFYDQVRDLVRAEKEDSIRRSLSPAQLKALEAVEAGESFEAATSRLGESSKEAVRASQEEIAQVQEWGIENYTTHIERGSYRVETESGGTVAVGRTRTEAAIKADKWLKEHPEVKSVTLTDEFSPGVEFPTKLSRGQYWRLISRLEETTGQDAKAVQELLHAQGSIVAVKPTSKYAAPLQQRRNVLKGEENVFDVLPLYSHVMRKKLALDPVLREAREVLPRLPENMRSQVEALVADVKGRKTVSDQIADYFLRPFGTEPFAFSRGVQHAKQAATVLKLGYRPVAAAINRIGGLQHTWTKAGTRWLSEGKDLIKTPEGKALIEANKPYIGMESSFTEAASEAPLYHPLGMFQRAERINRPEAFVAFYQMARKGMGMEEAAAAQYARNATRFAQFTYNTASLPRAMRGPTGRLLLQFKPYLVKEMEFLSTLRGEEIGRYLVGFLALGGPRSALIVLRSLPVLGALGVLASAEDWFNRELPRASRGVPGALGVDVSPAAAPQLPQEIRDWLGPVVGDLQRLYSDVVAPALKGEHRDLSDVKDWAARLAPIMQAWGNLVETFSEGEIRDWKGRLEFTPTQLDKIKMALGAKPLEQSILEVERRFLLQSEETAKKNRSRLLEDYGAALRKNDEQAIEALLTRLAEAGVDRATIKRTVAEQNLDAHERAMRKLPLRRRSEEREKRE